MLTVKSQLEQIDQIPGLKKQISTLKDQVSKEKSRADTFSFNLDTKEKTIKKFEKDFLEYKHKISILESKNQELMQELQESSQNSDDSFSMPSNINSKPTNLASQLNFSEAFSPRKSCLPTSHEQIAKAMIDLESQKSITENKKQKIKEHKERLRMCIEEMNSKLYSYQGIIKQLEENNVILSDQIQVINESLADKENDKVVHEQTMYELEEVKASKVALMNDIRFLQSEKENTSKKFDSIKEEFNVVNSQIQSKDMQIKELEFEIKVLREKILAADEKEKVYNMEIASLRKNPLVGNESQAVMDLERQIIALKSETSELKQRLEDQKSRSSRVVKTKEETIEKLQKLIEENKEKFNEEMEVKTKEIMAQSEEAMNELFKQREQLAAKLQFERRNTMIGWQRAMSVKDPTLLVSEEIFKLREALVEKEKEITRISKNNKELKVCWKDSAKLLKAVWKQLGDETKKIEDAVKKRHH
jgi:DNA repair exonuclease SbcCD ATPase subunit